jgi:hypothetical protein
MTTCDFNISHWSDVIKTALNYGYVFYSFNDWLELNSSIPERTIIIRHDVDVSLYWALCLAKVEAEFGVRGTYFIRLHSKFYNLEELASLEYLKNLTQINVDIALHYERHAYELLGGNQPEILARDVRLLGNIVGKPIKSCSAHRIGVNPPLDVETIKNAGLLCEAHTSEFVKERKYISDSARHWREGCLCQWLGHVNHLTVLTHPVWWFEPEEKKDMILEKIRRGD